MEQGKIMEAEVPTVRVGATPIGLMVPPPPQPPNQQRPINSVKALKAAVGLWKILDYFQLAYNNITTCSTTNICATDKCSPLLHSIINKSHTIWPCSKLDSNRRFWLHVKLIASVSWQYVSFSNAGVANQYNCQTHVTVQMCDNSGAQ